MKSFLEQKFDVLILSFFVILFGVSALCGVGNGFAQRTSDLFTGALLSLLTGKLLNHSNTPPDAPAN